LSSRQRRFRIEQIRVVLEQFRLCGVGNSVLGKRYHDQENEQENGHSANTLSPRILPTCGEGFEESWVGQLSAPPIRGATVENVAPLSDAPVALFLDVDGTLLDLAERPDDVVTPAGLVAALVGTERRLAGALALISGREIDDLDRLFRPLRFRASGVHGAEARFEPGGPVTQAPAAVELPLSLWKALTREVAEFPGAFAENKRFSFVVHYRLAPAAERPLRQAVTQLRRFWRIRRSAAGRRSLWATTRPTKAGSRSSPPAVAPPIRSAGRAGARPASSPTRAPSVSGWPNSQITARPRDGAPPN
jgi:hypothetical protein